MKIIIGALILLDLIAVSYYFGFGGVFGASIAIYILFRLVGLFPRITEKIKNSEQISLLIALIIYSVVFSLVNNLGLFVDLAIMLLGAIIFKGKLFKSPAKEENGNAVPMSHQVKKEDRKGRDNMKDTLVYVVPFVLLMTLKKDFGWTAAIWVALGEGVLAQLVFLGIQKYRKKK